MQEIFQLVKFPHDEAFGYWAWVAKTMEQAIRIFTCLEANIDAIKFPKE